MGKCRSIWCHHWPFIAITITAAGVALLLLLGGCAAQVKAAGGSSTVEHQESKPKTETVEIEVFGREPTADELYILHGLGKGARR